MAERFESAADGETEFDARFKEQEDESTKEERGRIMIENKVHEPIRKKIEEWIDYDVHKPDVPYRGNEKVHEISQVA